MLVLSREKGEEIVIRDDIVVTVLGVNENRVRIGVQAPQHVRIDRGEFVTKDKSEDDKRE